MTYLKHAAPRAALVIGILGVAAAATAMWEQYAPKGVCLYCATPEHYQLALNVPPKTPATTNVEVKHHSGLAVSSKPNIVPDTTTAASHDDGSAQHADAPHDWQPWNDEGETHESGEHGLGALWGGMGELRRMISVGHFAEPSGGIASAGSRASHGNSSGESHSGSDEGRPAVEPEPQSGAPASSSPAPSASAPPTSRSQNPGITAAPSPVATATPPSGGATSAATPPTNPFVEHTTAPSNPFAPPTALLSPGTPGGTVSSPRGTNPSPNPEPASVLLIGTGLAAAFNELRRRRAR